MGHTGRCRDGHYRSTTSEELAAIAYVLYWPCCSFMISFLTGKWKPCDAVSTMRKWGPSTRTVLAILADPDKEKGLRRYADRAAIDNCNDPPRVSLHDIERLPSDQGSTLLFIRPIRSKDNSDYGNSMFIIPTMRLSEIFDSRCQGLSVQSRLRGLQYASRNKGCCWLAAHASSDDGHARQPTPRDLQ